MIFNPPGVAPRAKMNQQRSRRFKAAKEAAAAAKKAEKAAAKTSDVAEDSKPPVFDSNCITPGTRKGDRGAGWGRVQA